MIIRTTLDEVLSKPLTDDQKKMIDDMKKRDIRPDEDCPAYSYEKLKTMKQMADKRRAEKEDQIVTLHLTPNVMEKVRALGSRYTDILARMIENGLNDPDFIKKAL